MVIIHSLKQPYNATATPPKITLPNEPDTKIAKPKQKPFLSNPTRPPQQTETHYGFCVRRADRLWWQGLLHTPPFATRETEEPSDSTVTHFQYLALTLFGLSMLRLTLY